MPYQPFRNFYTKWGGGGGHDAGQLRPESYSYTVAPSHRRSNFQQNKREARLSCYLALFSKKALFSETEKCYCLSMFITHTCMPPSDVFNFVFHKLFVHDFNEEGKCNASLGFLHKQFQSGDFENDNKNPIIYCNDNVTRLVKVN